MLPELSVEALREEAATFSVAQSSHNDPYLHGKTDGKTIGTYLERRFQTALRTKYVYDEGNAARGIDFPGLNVDMKVTSIKQPQSSSPFKEVRQKIYGLGYSLLVFVYEKTDDDSGRTGKLNILHTIFVDAPRTADFQTTRGILNIIENDGNTDDLIAFMHERNLRIDDDEAYCLAEELLDHPPIQGYLTVSNAYQWRLQYNRVIQQADTVPGVLRVK